MVTRGSLLWYMGVVATVTGGCCYGNRTVVTVVTTCFRVVPRFDRALKASNMARFITGYRKVYSR